MKTWSPDDTRWKEQWESKKPKSIRLAKHGSHNQKTHGRKGGGSSYEASPNALATLQEGSWSEGNYDEAKHRGFKEYRERYNGKPEDEVVADAAEFYAGEGYQDINNQLRGVGGANDMIDEESGFDSDIYISNQIAILDKGIAESPDVFGDKTLYRAFSAETVSDIQPGDTFIDKGFLSTTRIDITTGDNLVTRVQLGMLAESDDVVGIILPNPTRSGKGLGVDLLIKQYSPQVFSNIDREKEVLLPRGTPLLFLGFQEGDVERLAVFQRMDS